MNIKDKKTVLFICKENSAKSQMAEALLTYRAGDKFDVYSAGTLPEPIDIRAIKALHLFGVNTQHLVSKNFSEFADKRFDFVITLCDRANLECRRFPSAAEQLAWDFPDPKTRLSNDPFTEALTEINNRLSMFILVTEESSCANGTEPAQPNKTTPSTQGLPDFDPLSFYKTLTDDIRLKSLMLTHYHGELCVCELMQALEEASQPKVSRNLAVLKKSKVIIDRKHGQWVFYRINPDLPLWAKSVIAQTTENNIGLIAKALMRLTQMKNRPDKANFCK